MAPPANGGVVNWDSPTGDYTYFPATDYCGPDSFHFVANDSTVDSNLASHEFLVRCPTDRDFDGINNVIDPEPDLHSDDFSDGTTTGTILDRADQWIRVREVLEAESGVTVRAILGTNPATVSACNGSALLNLDAGEQVGITCGSVSIEVIDGPVDAVLVGSDGTEISVSLDASQSLTFYPETLVMTTPEGQADIIVTIDGQPVIIPGGNSSPVGIPIEVIIRPGADDGAVPVLNLSSNGVVPVAILGTEMLDVRQIDVTTVRFGGTGLEAAETHGRGHYEDTNDDGLVDLVLHFRIGALGIEPELSGTLTLYLTARLQSETPLAGLGEVDLRPPRPAGRNGRGKGANN